MFEISHYLTPEGKDIFLEWQLSLRDTKARIAIDRRINRIELGNFGDHKFCRDGVWELRIDIGPGYRVYFGKDGERLVILLAGGTKKRQHADIESAHTLWAEYKRRKREE